MAKDRRQFRDYEDFLIEALRDPEVVLEYLNTALESYKKDRNLKALSLAFKSIIAAQGGISKLASQTNLNRSSLRQALSAKTTPQIDIFFTILNGLGFGFSIRPCKKARLEKETAFA